METKAWAYRDAQNTLNGWITLTQEQAVQYILHGGNDTGMLRTYCLQVEHASVQVSASGKYPYNSDVVRVFMAAQGIKDTPEHLERTERLVYGSSHYVRARETVALYEKMTADGFVSVHDITEDLHGKRALLTGKTTLDWLTTIKDGEKVKLYCKGDVYGYQKPNMRTRYYRPQVDANLFVKIA